MHLVKSQILHQKYNYFAYKSCEQIFIRIIQQDNDHLHLSSDSNQDCALCGDNGRQKSRYATWGEMERTYLEKHLGTFLDNSALVCKKHFLEAKRHSQSSEHIPSWKNKAKFADPSDLPLIERCSNPKCENVASQRLIRPMFTTNNKLAEIFQTEHTNEPML